MMKGGGFYGLRTKQILLFFIGIVCTIIVVWTWEKTPIFSSLLPPHDQVLQLFPVDTVTKNQVPDLENGSQQVEGSVYLVPPSVVMNKTLDENSLPAVEENHEKNKDGVDESGFKKDSEGRIDLFSKQDLEAPTKSSKTDSAVRGEGVDEKQVLVTEKAIGSKQEPEGRNDLLPKQDVVAPMNSSKIDSVVTGEGTHGKQEENKIPVNASDSSQNSEERNNLMPKLDQETPKNSSKTDSTIIGGEGSHEKQDCNFAKGRWIADGSRPLYSGYGCKQWLSGMWACRLTQRTDFLYERLRWFPKDCEMKNFTKDEFLNRMRNKTLAFVGDSLGRQTFQSMMCMVTGGEERPDVIDVGWEYGLIKPRGAVRPDGWAYRFPSTNTTILYYWSASLCDLEPIDPTKPATDIAMHLDRPPQFLRRFLKNFDVLVLNTGHHWNRGKLNANRWVMHVGGAPNTNRKIADIGGAKNFTIYSIVNWVNSQLPEHPRLKVFYRSISPRHFFNGDWNTGGTCDSTAPGATEVLQDESSDPIAAGAVKGTNVTLLDITALSQLRDEGHISRYSIKATPGMQDCLHWCLPGIPDTWNEILAAQI